MNFVNNDTFTPVVGDIIRSSGQNFGAVLAQADSAAHSKGLLGVWDSTPGEGASGAIKNGDIVEVNCTGSVVPGDTLYLSAATAGKATKTSPEIQIVIGSVIAVRIVNDVYKATVYWEGVKSELSGTQTSIVDSIAELDTGEVPALDSDGTVYAANLDNIPDSTAGDGRKAVTTSEASAVAALAASEFFVDSSMSTAEIQAVIDSAGTVPVRFSPGTYNLTTALLLRTNLTIMGDGATLTYSSVWAAAGSFITGTSISNVLVSGLSFDGKGTWTSTPFANPYSAGNSVGFTNNQKAITLTGCTNVRLREIVATGLGSGVSATSCTGLEITGCSLTTLGVSGISMYSTSQALIERVVISGVLGNLTNAGDTTITNSKFADGVYLDGCTTSRILGCRITNMIRAGVCFAAGTNRNFLVANNVITNLNSCRGTERNHAIYSETNGVVDHTVVALGNLCDNTGAVVGTLGSHGITANGMTVLGNVVKGFSITGIYAINGVVSGGNVLEGNETGITVTASASTDVTTVSGNSIIANTGRGILASGVAGSRAVFDGNNISRNGGSGAETARSPGVFIFRNNTFANNGSSGTAPASKSGIFINRYYTNAFVHITGNTFVSSATEGASTGQLYAVCGYAGGDFAASVKLIRGNTFFFDGTWTHTYPANLGVLPTSYAYGAYSSSATIAELLSTSGNNNTKQPQPDAVPSANEPVIVGYAASAPASGDYRVGDIVLNSSIAAGAAYGWECTTAGTPGTWKVISTLES